MVTDAFEFSHIDSETSLEKAKEWKEKGNYRFKEKDWERSLVAYEKGVECLTNCAHGDSAEMRLALQSNIGLVLFKLERYEESIEECDKALNANPNATKVLLRRALARERIAPPDLLGAASDLKLYIERRNGCNDGMRALERIEKKLSGCDGINNIASISTTDVSKFDLVSHSTSPEYQRETVLKILDQSSPIREGEAFFIISFEWWEKWCNYTKLREALQGRNDKWFQFLRPIRLSRKLENNVHGDSDSFSSDDSYYDSISDENVRPGIIDNTAIINPYNVRQSGFHSLRPFLLRGYHFQVIPREVYAALRFWYTEKTPAIYRRATLEANKVTFFMDNPPKTFPPNSKRCSTCHSLSTLKCSKCSFTYYCSQECQISHWPYHKQSCQHISKNKNQTKYSHNEVQWRRRGLNNLGNTCFLNSALQCLSHVKNLSLYFLTNQYIKDINHNNPLGAGGGLAKSYDKVMKDLFFGSLISVSPSALKRAIALYAPRFAGCHQHDAQEFLAYLLDGLHEDLNRIKEKKYVEMPDVDGNREDMYVAGAEAWDAFKRRNDSLVMDTFYGQFKSTCVCPNCKTRSVAFDSFNHISLEIPQERESTRTVPLIFFPSNSGTSTPVRDLIPIRYSLVVNKNGLIFDLKVQLEKKCGINRAQLMIGDIYENSVYDIMQDDMHLSKIRTNDVLAAYEVGRFRNKCIHLIGTHFAPSKIPQNYENHALNNMQHLRLEKFGYPLISNFDATLSCEELWLHIWDQVSRFILYNNENIDNQPMDHIKKRFCIRFVDQNGNPQQLFSDSPNQGSLLPWNSSIPILNFLGNDSIDNFLFLSFEWYHFHTSEIHNIYKKNFECIRNHSTITKQKVRNNRMTLYRCFSTFTQPERLDEENKWYCPSCKVHVRAMKTMQLWNLPDVLVIHLKRFDHKNTRTKLETCVDFPTENLDLSPLRASDSASTNTESEHFVKNHIPAKYNLFGVINHMGKMGFGHYTAFAKEWTEEQNVEEKWKAFDDSKVIDIREDMVVSPAAYVLFYKRIEK